MALDALIWIDGIPGESADLAYPGWIEIGAFNLAATQCVSRLGKSSNGASAGKVYLSDFSIVKRVDTTTPKILEACCSGQHLSRLALNVFRSGGARQRYMEITFDQVVISGVDSGNVFGGSPLEFPLEVVRFRYAKIDVLYSQQCRESGLLIGQVSAGWDQKTNRAYG